MIVPPGNERRYRLCMWETPNDGYDCCVHLDGEFNVCKLHQPQFDDREEADAKFSSKHFNNDYTLDEWQQLLKEFQHQLGIRCPCDQNISGKEVVELINNGVIK